MRRVVSLGAVVLALVLSALAGSPAGHAAPATDPPEPTVTHSVRVLHRQMDLTEGPRRLVLRVTAHAARTLDLTRGIMTSATPWAMFGVNIETEYHNTYVMGSHPIKKLSGGDRGGVWRVRIPLQRHLPADAYHLSLDWNVGGVEAESTLTKTVVVTNPHSDTHAPVLVSLNRPAEEATFSRHDRPQVSLHLRDRGAGISLVWVCYLDTDDVNEEPCDEAHLASGTIHDGTWTTRMTNLTMLHPGDGAFRIQLNDRVTLFDVWDPADQPIDDFSGRVIPDGRGDFTLTR